METDRRRNPFHILGATPRDDRHRILELYEERSLRTDADLCRQAREDLIHPRNRLVAELGWLPEPASAGQPEGLSALAHANLLAARWESLGPDAPLATVAAFIGETAEVLNRVSAADALRDINADRAVSGFPIVSSEHQVHAELAARMAAIGSMVSAALNRLPTSDLIDAMRAAVGPGSEGGTRGVLPFIDDLVDRHYEVGTRGFLEAQAAAIMTLIEAAKGRARFGESALTPYLAELDDVVRRWQRVAAPILICAKRRGINPKPAVDLAGSLRELSIYLNNEHHMYASMRRLNTLLIECFADLPYFLPRLEEDAAFLQKTASDYKAWADKVSFHAQIGLFRKDVLSICPSGAAWNGSHYPLKTISSIRFGGVRRGMYSLLGLPSYVVAFGDPASETVISLTNESIYDRFIEKFWCAVGPRLTAEMYTALKAGTALQFADTVVRDECIELPRRILFGKRQMISCAWDEIKTWNYDGRCIIASTADRKARVGLPYANVRNVAVLWSAINAARKKPGLRKLSELLDGK
jgi:hypothetical protein